jgi:hypothetical protein
VVRKTGSVQRAWSDRKISAARNSFHAEQNANSATVTAAGLATGTSTRPSVTSGPAPSSAAASSSSRGRLLNALRMTNRANGSWNVT